MFIKKKNIIYTVKINKKLPILVMNLILFGIQKNYNNRNRNACWIGSYLNNFLLKILFK